MVDVWGKQRILKPRLLIFEVYDDAGDALESFLLLLMMCPTLLIGP